MLRKDKTPEPFNFTRQPGLGKADSEPQISEAAAVVYDPLADKNLMKFDSAHNCLKD